MDFSKKRGGKSKSKRKAVGFRREFGSFFKRRRISCLLEKRKEEPKRVKKKKEQGRVCFSLGEGSVSFGLAEDTPGHLHVPRCKRKESFVTLQCRGGKSLI